MRSNRGGAIYGFLAAIGVIVVLMAIFFSACFSNVGAVPRRSLGRVELIRHDRCRHDRCGDRYGDGDSSNGNTGYDGEGGHGGDQGDAGHDQCHSFCNNIIVIPDPTKKDQPKSLTDPRKLPQVIAQIAKSGLDMGQLFATTTIKFVEDLFTALA